MTHEDRAAKLTAEAKEHPRGSGERLALLRAAQTHKQLAGKPVYTWEAEQ
jgi:hypothetical protein